MLNRIFRGCTLFCLLLQPAYAIAGESILGYVLTTDTVPKGKWGLQEWYSGKFGKLNGSYANSLYRTQIEYGVTDAYQVALSASVRHIFARRNNRDETTGGEDVTEKANPRKSFNQLLLDQVSVENLYRFTSPVTSPFGTVFSLESAFGSRQIGIIPKVVFQKNFLDDQLTWPINLSWSLLWNHKTGGKAVAFDSTGQAVRLTKRRWTRQTQLDLSTGLSYRFRRNWSSGVEFRVRNDFSSFKPSDIAHTAFFLGPNLHFAARNFWATLTVLFQLPPAVGYTNAERDMIESGRIFGDAFEAVEVRVKVGYAFD